MTLAGWCGGLPSGIDRPLETMACLTGLFQVFFQVWIEKRVDVGFLEVGLGDDYSAEVEALFRGLAGQFVG